MSLKRKRSATPVVDAEISRSSPITDRSSKFIAFYSPSISAKEIQAESELATAMHRMAAWRKPSTQRALTAHPVMETGHDDDGEKYGGKTLEKLLLASNVEGTVVVARWYGGVLLGPVRFDHIRNCAREAISKWTEAQDIAGKRRKVQEEAERKVSLVNSLPERDRSITVLRGLLVEKKGSNSSGLNVKSSPSKTPDYSNLPLVALERLEQARDATIAWLLKQIEKAEAVQADSKGDEKAIELTTNRVSDLTKAREDPAKEPQISQSCKEENLEQER